MNTESEPKGIQRKRRQSAKRTKSAAPADRPGPSRERPTRIPYSAQQVRLAVANQDPAFYYYWQKDVGDNLQRMLDAGYDKL